MVAMALVAGVAAAPRSARADQNRIFALPSEDVGRATERFAIQGRVSIGGLPTPGCSGRSHATYGLMSPARALSRLLPAGCGFQAIDAGGFRVFAAPPAPRPPVAPPIAPPRAADVIDEIVVTAERRTEPLVGRAYPITVMTGEDLRRLGGATFADLALQTGVTVTNLGPGRNKIFVRGLSDGSFTGRTQSTVGLYLDDVPITYSAPDPDLRLVDVERIEVLRGPQGTLYGSGSIGGIVRIVTAKPDPQTLAASAAVEARTTQRGADGTGVDATLNLPLLAGRAALRASVYRDEQPGYIDNTSLGLTDVNYGQRSGLRAAGLVEVPGDWRILAGYAHQSINTRDSQYAQGGGGPLTRDNLVREPHDNDFTEVSASASHGGRAVDVKISAAFIDHSLQTRYDATGALGMSGRQAFDEDRRVDLSVAEAVLSSAGEGRLTWLAGLFASRTDETDHALIGPPEAMTPGQSVYRRRDHFSEGAIYGEAAYDLTDRLTLTGGARLFASRLASQTDRFDLAPGLAVAERRFKDTGVAPKLRVSYAWSPELVIYGQFQAGYRAGGFNIPAAADGVSNGTVGAAYQPDRLRSYEAGGEAAFFDRALRVRAAVFHADWSRLQTDQYLPSGLPMTVNIGDGSNTGLEAEASWRPDDHWLFRTNLLVEDPSITRTSDAFPATVDIGLPGVPSFLGSVDARFGWRVTDRLRGEVTGQFAYVGHSYLTFNGGAQSRMGDYGVGRLAFGLTSEHGRLQVYMDNVADARGDTFAFGNPFSRERAKQSTPLRPRTVGVSLSRDF